MNILQLMLSIAPDDVVSGIFSAVTPFKVVVLIQA